MEIRKYRARSLQEALRKVHEELGPNAKVVQSREVETGWWERVSRGRRYEIRTRQSGKSNALELRKYTSAGIDLESRAETADESQRRSAHDPYAESNRQDFTESDLRRPVIRPDVKQPIDRVPDETDLAAGGYDSRVASSDGHHGIEVGAELRAALDAPPRLSSFEPSTDRTASPVIHRTGNDVDIDDALLPSQIKPPVNAGVTEGLPGVSASIQSQLAEPSTSPQMNHVRSIPNESPDAAPGTPLLFDLLTELVDADVPEEAARELVEYVSSFGTPAVTLSNLRDRLLRHLADHLRTTGPIDLTEGQQKIIALVGPTGVGKTTTIAKLAANLRLCERRRVGLITVDTFRVAAVEQLRTYAEIMDLPMEVVTTPREMREARTRLSDEDVILIDTAGRSPQDAVQLQQLKSMLSEAAPQEIQLVVSCTASSKHLQQVVDCFAPIGCTSILATKLDEVMSLGNLVPLLKRAALPFSYLTCGQNVPDDIVIAHKSTLLPALIGQQPISTLV